MKTEAIILRINRRFVIGFCLWIGYIGVSPILSFAQSVPAPKSVHIIVVLADNANQGIGPVPAKLGDGQAPRTNLYWGALYGVKSYFNRQPNIQKRVVTSIPPPSGVIDEMHYRLTLASPEGELAINIHAEAWRGDKMRGGLKRFYKVLADTEGADLVVFVGHNGLMDGPIMTPISIAGQPKTGAGKDAMVLACMSESYFSNTLKNLGVRPVLMTRGLMAPEAYSLLPAIEAWALDQSQNDIRNAAASGYAKYQKIPLRNAQRLFGAKPS